MTITKLSPGDRVRLTGDHIWRGQSGVFESWEKTAVGRRPRVLLDNGTKVFVMKDGQWERAGE